MRRKNSIWVLFMAGLMAGSIACGDDDTANGGNDAGNGTGNGAIDTGNGGNGGDDTGNGGDPDGGLPDADPTDTGGGGDTGGGTDTGVDTGVDTGPVDTGVDAGPPPPATEGEACSASTDETSMALEQDDCDTGLSCVPWDSYLINLLGNDAPPEITVGSIQSCVQECEVDADCVDPNDPNDTTTTCSRSQLVGTTLGNIGVCVEDLAGVDEACGASALSTRLIRNADGQLTNRIKDDPSTLVGCEEGLSCQHAIIGWHPDEGFCQEICASDADCTNPDAEFCYPDLFGGGEGYCGARDFDEVRHGRYCGELDAGDKVVRVANGCGFGTGLSCRTLGGQETPTGNLGLCFEECSQADQVCDKTVDGNGLGQGVCVVSDNDPNAGVCFSNCNSILAGGEGLCPTGQFCTAYNLPLTQTVTAQGVTVCQPYLDPRLAATEFDDAGNTTSLGGDCGAGGFDGFRCPNGYSCQDSGSANPAAICTPLCDRRATNVDAACENVTGNNGDVCGLTTTSTIVGICGTPAP